MKRVETINGKELREMFAAATSWLEKSAGDIDALNVFPVPDGDTGTNMLLTMRSTVEESFQSADTNAGAVVEAMAKGALMGARGNSGVILSQIWRGIADALKEKKSVNGQDIAAALDKAATTAYRGISNPVEGTILTVIKDTAKAARAQASGANSDIVSVLEAAVTAANESVANTPALLPVLRKAGVVDAGGQGLYTILEGALRYLRGEAEQMQFRKPQIIASNLPQPVRPAPASEVEVPYGYCTEFLLKGDGFKPDDIRTRLKKRGQSLIVVGDEKTVRVHVHTLDPGGILRYATSLGTMHQVSIRNMDEQYQDFLEMQRERTPATDIATVAVASGEGLAEVFTSLGATVVPGGQTMNPSTKDLLQAVNAALSDKVVLLPNNKNVVMTAQQVQALTRKRVEVVPSETMPQGVAALLAFDYEADFETNIKLMNEAKSRVRTIEVTRAVRSAQLDGLNIKKRQAIGLLDGELLTAGENTATVLNRMLAKLRLKNTEVITIYYGADTDHKEAEQIANNIREHYPTAQVEVVRGGQPHYNYIVSIE